MAEHAEQQLSLICIVDDDVGVRGSLDSLLRSAGFAVLAFAGPDDYLACADADRAACLLLDTQLDGANGLDFQQALLDSEFHVPVILISGHGDIPQTVRGMKAGAVSFLAKPFAEEALLLAVGEAVEADRRRRDSEGRDRDIRLRFDTLTEREREVMALVTAGLMNKQVAGKLSLSEITVKIHRGNLMRKMEAGSLADLVRMAEALGARDTSATRYHRPG